VHRLAEASVALTESTSLTIQTRLSDADRYNRWIYAQIEPFLGRRILDVGCAIGNITQFYMDRDQVIGLDVLPESLEVARERFAGRKFEAYQLDVSSERLLQFRDRNLDTAVCLNVLEHVEDDVHALRNMRDTLTPGSRICVLVPVNKWLYGPMDVVDHHYRRYTRAEFNAKAAEADLVIEHQRYFNMLGIAAWFFTNKIMRRSLAAPVQYSLYDRLVPLLRALEGTFPPPAGLSLVTICRTQE
jgi:2-polyprenyl-3-methyl-5-hydroxy-6-metoxy-1,4-benzoquinol methylase